MRMTIRVTLGVLTAMLGTLFVIGLVAGPAAASPSSATAPVAVARPATVPQADIRKAASPTTTPATPTTDYNKGQQTADAALAKRKLILGGICVVLLVIVYLGHRAKGKHVLRVKNLQNAKS
jgi:hypothetical protein